VTAAPPRVLHLVETLARGGAERMVVDLATAQRAGGVDAAIACLFADGILGAEARAAGVTVHVIGKQAGFDWGATRRLRTLARGHAVVHTHNAVANYYAALASLPLRGWRQINTRHGMGAAMATDRREQLFRLSLRRTDRVACVCEAARQAFVGHGVVPARLATVIPNGIRTGLFAAPDPAARAQARERLGVGTGAYVVGTVGRLNWAKDHALLLEAFARLRAGVPAAVLCMIGDGELRATLHAAAAGLGLGEAVRWLGDRSDVPALLPGLDTFVLSSRTEGYSMALLEAAAAGLPLVATDVGGNREIVADGVNGRLVPHGDPVALAAALAEHAEGAVAAARGAAALAWAGREATTATMTARYAAEYHRLVPLSWDVH
jgi:glycosyltransferase involved in cell wall biosynthesis